MAILADSFYYQELRIDTINTRVYADLLAKEGDANGRGLLVTLTENGLMKDTTGITLILKWEHTSVGNQGLDNFETVDLSKGLYKITYPTEMLNRGKVRAFIQIIDSGKLAGTRNIEITVDRGVGDDTAIASSDSFSALASALIEVQSWNNRIDVVEQEFIDKSNNLDATYPTRLVSVETQLADTDTRIDNIIATAGDGTIPTELSDTRLGDSGVLFTTSGANVRTVGGVAFTTANVTDIIPMELGSYTTAGVKETNNVRLRLANEMTFYPNDVISVLSTMDIIVINKADGTYLKNFDGKSFYVFNAQYDCYVYFKKKDGSVFNLATFDKSGIKLVSPTNLKNHWTAQKEIIKNLSNITTKINLENGTINTDGTFSESTTSIRTPKLIKFKVGDTVTVDTSLKFAVLLHDNGVFTIAQALLSTPYTFTADSEAYLYFKKVDNTDINVDTIDFDRITILSPSNATAPNKPHDGIKWAVVGDSLTDLTVHTPNKYHALVAKDTGVEVLDYGNSGSGFKREEDVGTAFYQRVTTIPSDTDIVTIFGGGNDCSQAYTMGTATDTGTTTLCGAINTTIDNIEAAAPLAQIAIVSPTPWSIYPTTNPSNKMKELTGKLEEISKIRGCKFLDLYHTSGLRPLSTEFTVKCFVEGSPANSVHLNDYGHKFIYASFKQLVLSMVDSLS